MKKEKTPHPDQVWRDLTWKHYCNWHDEHPLYLLCFIYGSMLFILGTFIWNRNADPDTIIRSVLLVFFSIVILLVSARWYTRFVLCRSKRVHKKIFHKRAVH
jgi:hypothetical protein